MNDQLSLPTDRPPSPGDEPRVPSVPASRTLGAQPLRLTPMTVTEGKRFTTLHHRHHPKVTGAWWAVAVSTGDQVRGAALVGHPQARELQDGYTAEILRCTTDGAKNACSMLYGAAWRAARALGFLRLVTYTGKDEPGTSLIAAGYRIVGEVTARPHGWDTPGRPRVNAQPTIPKWRWEPM